MSYYYNKYECTILNMPRTRSRNDAPAAGGGARVRNGSGIRVVWHVRRGAGTLACLGYCSSCT